jgi:2,3-bisphosphoglycerate-independent phosphoglycerate mutase
MRCILLILDGIGDKGHPAYDGRTPLQVADTPNLDYMAMVGMNGHYHSYLQGVAMSSELAHFLIFGYDLNEFPGRGYIQALGCGIELEDGDLALLARIFPVRQEDGMLILLNESPDLDEESCRILQEEIRTFRSDGVEVEFIPTKGIEGILRLRGNVSSEITDSNPIYTGRPLMEVLPLNDTADPEGAILTSGVLNSYIRWAYRKLSDHPINRERERKGLQPFNAVGVHRAGIKREIQPFIERWGLKGLSISSGPLYQGICSLLGMDIIRMTDSGDPENDLRERLRIARTAGGFDFVHVHTKAPDIAAHTKDPGHKKTVIESIDRAMKYAVDEIITDEEILFIVTSDHSTASAGMMVHSGETVPLTMTGRYVRRDDVREFSEVSCARGGLGLVRGKELMYLVLNLLDRGKLWTHRESPANEPYTPGRYRPLRVDTT